MPFVEAGGHRLEYEWLGPRPEAAPTIVMLHEGLGCRALFATHYHEMARLAETCEALSLHHVRAKEWKGDLVFLHEIVPGGNTPSTGALGLQHRLTR